MTREPMDELDLLFNRMEPVDLPPNFHASVMAKTVYAQARFRIRPIWIVVDVIAALVLTWAAFTVGRLLAVGSFDHGAVGLLLDPDLLFAAPAEWLIAVGELAPVGAIVGLIVAIAVVRRMRGTPGNTSRLSRLYPHTPRIVACLPSAHAGHGKGAARAPGCPRGD